MRGKRRGGNPQGLVHSLMFENPEKCRDYTCRTGNLISEGGNTDICSERQTPSRRHCRFDACAHTCNIIDIRTLSYILKTGDVQIVQECQVFFGFQLPSILLTRRMNNSHKKYGYGSSVNAVCTFLCSV